MITKRLFTERWTRAGGTSEGRGVQLRGHRLQRFGEFSGSDGVGEQGRVHTLGLRGMLDGHLVGHQYIDLFPVVVEAVAAVFSFLLLMRVAAGTAVRLRI